MAGHFVPEYVLKRGVRLEGLLGDPDLLGPETLLGVPGLSSVCLLEESAYLGMNCVPCQQCPSSENSGAQTVTVHSGRSHCLFLHCGFPMQSGPDVILVLPSKS